MFKKKLTLIGIGLAIIISLCACKNDTNTSSKPTEKTEETEEMSEENEEIAESNTYEPTQEILDAEPGSKKVQFKDKVYTFPCTFSELFEGTGMTFDDDDISSEDYMCMTNINVSPKRRVDCDLNGVKIEISFRNPHGEDERGNAKTGEQDNTFALKDGIVTGFEIGSSLEQDSLEPNEFENAQKLIYLPKGVHIGNNVKEIQTLYGKEKIINEMEAYKQSLEYKWRYSSKQAENEVNMYINRNTSILFGFGCYVD